MDKALRAKTLRAALARLDPFAESAPQTLFSLGATPVDAALGGGLARGALHEILAPRAADIAPACGFALGLYARMATPAPLFWLRQRKLATEAGDLHAPALAEMGIDPARLVIVTLDTIPDLLAAGHDVLRCPGVGALILESWGASPHIDLTASRRLALAARQSGVTGLWTRALAAPEPSAAATRWRIAALPSSDPLGLPGRAAFSAELLRLRGGVGDKSWPLEWTHDQACFSIPALSGAVAPALADRPAPAHRDAPRARAR